MLRLKLLKTFQFIGLTKENLSAVNPLHIRKKGTRTKALFALSLVCILWGTTWVASKIAVQQMPALQMAGIRQLIGGFCYMLFFIVKGAKLPGKKDWGPIMILCILNFVFSNALSTWGVKYISAGLASIIGAIFPLWMVVIALFSKNSMFAPKAVVGLLFGFGGVCIIFYEHLSDFLIADFRFGIFLSLTATLTWAFGTLYTKKHAVNFNPYFSLGLQMFIAGIGLTSFTEFTNLAIPIADIPWESWAAIAYLVIFGSILAFVAYLYALQNLATEQVSIYAYVNPMVAVLLGWLIFQEKLTIFIAVGGLVTLYGVYLVNKSQRA